MGRSLRVASVLAVFAAVSVLAVPAAVASSAGFSMKGFGMSVRSGRLYYTLTICAPRKAAFIVQGTFLPRSGGAITARPGSMQYQSAGCWPAQVSVAIVKQVASCAPTSCPAQQGSVYEGSVVVTDASTHRSERAPRRKLRAG